MKVDIVMRKLTYLAVFEPTETGYSVYFPDLLVWVYGITYNCFSRPCVK